MYAFFEPMQFSTEGTQAGGLWDHLDAARVNLPSAMSFEERWHVLKQTVSIKEIFQCL
jgi:hypothetical protein